jgi:SAM-dependent methyltransferase
MHKVLIKLKYLSQIGLKSSLILISRKVFRTKSNYFNKYRYYFLGDGIEVAGPSSIFKQDAYYPVYGLAHSLDNVNYSSATRWHGNLGETSQFVFNKNKKPGRQIINEASNLIDVNSKSYDFLISNHMLEHTANPIKVLYEWKRVVRDGGLLLVVLPHKARTFDHRRPLTTLNHLIKDYEMNTGEDDQTHIPEIMQLHDCSLDYSNPTAEALRSWMSNNYETRGAHHHVFNAKIAAELFNYAGFEILDIEISLPSDIFIIARNPADKSSYSNARFLEQNWHNLEFSFNNLW